MNKRKAAVVLIAAMIILKAVMFIRKRKKRFITCEVSEDITDMFDEDIAGEFEGQDEKEIEKAEALERILSDVEKMYGDREEVPVPKRGNRLKVTALAVLLVILTGVLGSESVSAKTQDVIKEESEEQFEEIPELIARAAEPEKSGRFSYEDVYLLARLVSHESENQERDGKAAVAEIVLNRINSEKFPDTVSEVLFQPGQFTSRGVLDRCEPSEESVEVTASVLNGNLRVLNNKDVVFYRNPMITSGIRPEVTADWGRYPYFGSIGEHAFYLIGN